MKLKYASAVCGVLCAAFFTACDSGSSSSALGEGASSSSAVGEVSPESSAAEVAKGSFAAVVDTASRTVSYYVPTCNLVGGVAVFESAGDTVNASYALSGDSLLWSEEDDEDLDVSVFTGENGGSLFGIWTMALDEELPGAFVEMEISPNAVKPDFDFSELCLADAVLSELEGDEEDSETMKIDRKDCNHFSYSMDYSGISFVTEVSATTAKDSFAVVYKMEIPDLELSQECTVTTTMRILSEDLCTVENLTNGKIDDGIYSSTVTEGDCAEESAGAAVLSKAMIQFAIGNVQ